MTFVSFQGQPGQTNQARIGSPIYLPLQRKDSRQRGRLHVPTRNNQQEPGCRKPYGIRPRISRAVQGEPGSNADIREMPPSAPQGPRLHLDSNEHIEGKNTQNCSVSKMIRETVFSRIKAFRLFCLAGMALSI